MKIINKSLFLVLIVLIIVSLFSVKIDISKAQGSAKKYTVFKTENEGFKFYKIFNNQKLWAPLFAETPTTTSDKNQVATKEYVDSRASTGIENNIRYYRGSYCFNPEQEMVIGGSDRDWPIISTEPKDFRDGNNANQSQEASKFLYIGPSAFDYSIRTYPVGILNSKWVTCLRINENPQSGYIIVPQKNTGSLNGGISFVSDHSQEGILLGSCEGTEDYQERQQGYMRYWFPQKCSWRIKKWCSGCSFGVTNAQASLPIFRTFRQKINGFSLDLYTNDVGSCSVVFYSTKGSQLKVSIQRGGDKGYSQAGPVVIRNWQIEEAGSNANLTNKILFSKSIGDDTGKAEFLKQTNSTITPNEFWENVYKIEMSGQVYNSVQLGLNICNAVLLLN